MPLVLGKLDRLYPESDLAQLVDTRSDLHVWQPCYAPGDLMIFDPFTIHGTHFHEAMQEHRYSLEVRLCPQDHVLDQPAERIHRIYRFQSDDFIQVGSPETPVWRDTTS